MPVAATDPAGTGIDAAAAEEDMEVVLARLQEVCGVVFEQEWITGPLKHILVCLCATH
jgi:hypothetical protein